MLFVAYTRKPLGLSECLTSLSFIHSVVRSITLVRSAAMDGEKVWKIGVGRFRETVYFGSKLPTWCMVIFVD